MISGIIGLAKLGVRVVDILVRGNSTLARTLLETERYRGSLATNSPWVFTTLPITHNINVKESIHRPGTQNSRCDQLPLLGVSGETVSSSICNCGLGSPRILDLRYCKYVRQILRGCYHEQSFRMRVFFTNYWSDIRDASEATQQSRGRKRHLT